MFICLASSLAAGSRMVSRPDQFFDVAPPQLGQAFSSESRWQTLQALDMDYAPVPAFSAFLAWRFVTGFSLGASGAWPGAPPAAASRPLRRSSSIHSNLPRPGWRIVRPILDSRGDSSLRLA